MALTNISKVYENADFLVINKPAGLITHPKNNSDRSPSVTDWVLINYPTTKNVGEYADRPGIMHRLDKETSGLLVIAKNQPTYDYFKNLFQTRAIHKHYLALVVGHPKSDHGIVDAPLGRIGMKRTTIVRNGKLRDEKDAVTTYKTRQTYRDFTLLEIVPKTGRTHQIRVHMQHIGHPIVGDALYGRTNTQTAHQPPRMFLHAYRLDFTDPNGQALSIEADLPEDLQNFLNTLE